MTKRRTGWMRARRYAAVSGLGFALLAPACKEAAKEPESAIQAVRAGIVEEIQPSAPERYSASILPSAQVDLAFKSPGLIESIYQVRGADGRMRNVQVGDKVIQGTQLAVVRQLDYVQRLEQAKQQASQAQAQIAQAEAAFHQAELDLARAENLYKTASLTKPEYDQAKARYESVKAQMDGAQAVAAAAQTAISEAQLSLSDTLLCAPFSGWITARNVERGSLVGGSFVGFSLIDTSVVKAIFAVSDTSLKNIRLGQRLMVSMEALAHPAAGIITGISPQADPKSRVFSVEVSIANPREEIRPGMIGSISLSPAGESRRRLVVPLSAVIRDPNHSGGFALFCLEEQNGQFQAKARAIGVGSAFGNSIEVTNGVAAGQRIIVLGGELLRDGQRVRILL